MLFVAYFNSIVIVNFEITMCRQEADTHKHVAVLVVNYGISNTIVLEIP